MATTLENPIGRPPLSLPSLIRKTDFRPFSHVLQRCSCARPIGVIVTLRAHEAELRQAVLRSLSLFSSVAPGETETDSDIDLAAEF
jgi:hypothetical protein